MSVLLLSSKNHGTKNQSISHSLLKWTLSLLHLGRLFRFGISHQKCHTQVVLHLTPQRTLNQPEESLVCNKTTVLDEYGFLMVLNDECTALLIYCHGICYCCHLTLWFESGVYMHWYRLCDYSSLTHFKQGIVNSNLEYLNHCMIE